MSWSTSFVVIKGRSTEDVLSWIDGARLTGEVAAAPDVFTAWLPPGSDFALTEIDGWCVIAEPLGVITTGNPAHGDLLPALSKGTVAIGFFLGGVTGTCAFRIYVDGIERRWIIHEARAILEERGAPLPEEADIPMPAWGYDEDWIFTLLDRLTGLTWAKIEPQRFVLALAPTLMET